MENGQGSRDKFQNQMCSSASPKLKLPCHCISASSTKVSVPGQVHKPGLHASLRLRLLHLLLFSKEDREGPTSTTAKFSLQTRSYSPPSTQCHLTFSPLLSALLVSLAWLPSCSSPLDYCHLPPVPSLESNQHSLPSDLPQSACQVSLVGHHYFTLFQETFCLSPKAVAPLLRCHLSLC